MVLYPAINRQLKGVGSLHSTDSTEFPGLHLQTKGKRVRERVDNQGRAFAGSQLQFQIYVSRREPELTASV
ncbi:MAG: hypothetical protein K0S45_4029, partial [Nitrospira sp.]|nr:hypothetical protein [Nitrospira sp.]